MVLTPLAVMAIERLTPPEKESMDGIEEAAELHGRVLFVGFGRFAQVVSQPLLAKGIDVSIIEIDVEMIRQPDSSASRSITAMARGSTCCGRRARERLRPRWSASTSRKQPTRLSSW